MRSGMGESGEGSLGIETRRGKCPSAEGNKSGRVSSEYIQYTLTADGNGDLRATEGSTESGAGEVFLPLPVAGWCTGDS